MIRHGNAEEEGREAHESTRVFMLAAQPQSLPAGLVIYDGLCPLCTWGGRLLFRLGGEKRFHFLYLQDPRWQDLKEELLSHYHSVDSIVFYDGENFFIEGDAILGIIRRLPLLFRPLLLLAFIPKKWRDAAYRYIARRRQQWYGQHSKCPLPQPNMKDSFI
jgi:predicted DCC family thiol-disulfide oxidoreductase YuxK